jgi:adenylyltransferase/sulfurtransferase
MTQTRYDRQARISGWDQGALARAKVLVVGAGALGNELLKNLALLGVGSLLIVDFDHIETSNLSRTVLFREPDVNQPKAKVAAVRVREINPEVGVRDICGNVFHDIGLGFYRHSDLVIGCLDNIAARSHVGISCALTGVPYLDGGMWGLGGEVRWFLPGDSACFECTLTDEDRLQAFQRRSCTGFKMAELSATALAVPTTINTAAIIGGLLSQEAARLLCGWEVVGGEALVYNGVSRTMHRSTLTRDLDCAYHTPYRDIVALDHGAEAMTGATLLALARRDLGESPVIELGRDFLVSFRCPRCDNREQVNQLIAMVEESRAKCPVCSAMRVSEVVSSLAASDALNHRKLSELGVPPGEILAVRTGEQMRFYELSPPLLDIAGQ